MDGTAVARRCADLTQEIFEVAKMSLEAQQRLRIERNRQALALNVPVVTERGVVGNGSTEGFGNSAIAASIAVPQFDLAQAGVDILGNGDAFNIDANTLEEDFLASLIDPKILDSFGANFMGGDWMDQSLFEGLDFSQGFEA